MTVSYSLSVYSDDYLKNVRTVRWLNSSDWHKYSLYSYSDSDGISENPSMNMQMVSELNYILETDSKSELKLRMAVYGLKYDGCFILHDSVFGRYAELKIVAI